MYACIECKGKPISGKEYVSADGTVKPISSLEPDTLIAIPHIAVNVFSTKKAGIYCGVEGTFLYVKRESPAPAQAETDEKASREELEIAGWKFVKVSIQFFCYHKQHGNVEMYRKGKNRLERCPVCGNVYGEHRFEFSKLKPLLPGKIILTGPNRSPAKARMQAAICPSTGKTCQATCDTTLCPDLHCNISGLAEDAEDDMED